MTYDNWKTRSDRDDEPQPAIEFCDECEHADGSCDCPCCLDHECDCTDVDAEACLSPRPEPPPCVCCCHCAESKEGR